GYTREDGTFKPTDQSATSATLGDGGIYSNVRDLAKWDDGLTSYALLDKQQMSQAWTPVRMPDGSPYYWPGNATDNREGPPKVVDYGFGWFLDAYQGRVREYHDGESVGFRSTIERYVKDNLTIIILSNRTDRSPRALGEGIADLILSSPYNECSNVDYGGKSGQIGENLCHRARRYFLSHLAETGELAEALHLGAGSHRPILLHHRAHLQILLHHLIHLLHRSAAALGDALATFAIDHVMVPAFFIGHGIDDRLDLLELFLVNLCVFRHILQWPDLRQHIDKLFERPHLANLLQLIAKIFQRELLLAQFSLEFHRRLFIEGTFRFFNQREYVAHAQHARHDTFWIETL